MRTWFHARYQEGGNVSENDIKALLGRAGEIRDAVEELTLAKRLLSFLGKHEIEVSIDGWKVPLGSFRGQVEETVRTRLLNWVSEATARLESLKLKEAT